MKNNIGLVVCHDCDLLQKISHLPEDGTVKCCRCSGVLRKRQRIEPAESIQHTLALTLAGLVLFIISNSFPILSLQVEGHVTHATLFSTVGHFFSEDMQLLGGLVFFTAIAAPLIHLAGMLYLFLPLSLNRVPYDAPQVYRTVQFFATWNMLEVLMLGILVSIVKLATMATVIPGVALYSFAALIMIIAAIIASIDTETVWEKIGAGLPPNYLTGLVGNDILTNCHSCNLLCTLGSVSADDQPCCPRCASELHGRKPNSISRSMALLLAAAVLYVPANILPMMDITSLGSTEGDTIMSGVIYLATSGSWPLALVVFVASIFIPVLKLLILSFLLISIRLNSRWRPVERTRLYRLIESVGRWSFVDIYVVALMAALVQIQGLMEVEAGTAAVAFGSVVVFTMFATMDFDPRLIWDHLGKTDD